jgi:hypothetical protein
MALNVTPASLSNAVMLGNTPDAQSFTVHNPGAGSFVYAVTTSAGWLTPTPSSGTLGPDWSEPIQIAYGSTAGWSPGVSNATVTIASTNGGGVTQTVTIALTVVELLPPTSVSATKGTYTDKVRITWSAAANATGYQVWRNTVNESLTAELQGTTSSTTYDDTTAAQGSTYYYWVKSTNVLGVSAFSASDSGSLNLPAPSGVSATKRTYTDKVRITWSAVSSATGYEVWRNTSSDSATATKIGSATSTTFDDTTAVAETTYYYWVKATNSVSTSAFSASDTGIRKQETPAPAAPTGLTASQGTYTDHIVLSWAASTYATSYEVWRNTTSSSSSATKLGDTTDVSYSDTAVTAATTYYYWVKAKNTTGTSDFSSVASGYCLDMSLIPIFADFDGDRKADPAVYQVGTGNWFMKLSASGYGAASLRGFGGSGYTAFAADFDGDGKADLCIYNNTSGDWQVKLSGSGYATATALGFGGPDIVPVAVDFDGDGKADPAIYNTATGNWRIMLSGSGYGIATVVGFGGSGFTQVSAVYDSAGKASPAIYGDSTGNWAIMLAGSGYVIATLPGFGGTGSTPLTSDFDGDRLVDPAYYKASASSWYIKLSASGYGLAVLSGFGGAGYAVGAIDFDGDGKADPAMFQDSTRTWYIKLSASGYVTVTTDSGYTP